ncbi:MAG: M24 family metallopeptidase [Candidatus Latescibacteria bacterium]|nr:M24 family metallopeptidase [bacterium]MBD3424879.1 M24 family metallopeptidase [Candidatus Latescibacterota bacterium]
MLKEKIRQAGEILREEGIDLWLTFVRESETSPDPALDLILQENCTWQSAFMIPAGGRPVAIVGSLDSARIEAREVYEVIGYKEGIGRTLTEKIDEIGPGTIAVNFSENDVMADGLSHGMYLILERYLSEAGYSGKLVSSEKLISKLRGRKTPGELERITRNIELTLDIFSRVTGMIKPGMTEREVAAFILSEVDREGVETSWDRSQCPAVFTGPESAGAHAEPTGRKIEKGHVLNIDFGTRMLGYCSDLQRTWYFLREGEEDAPREVREPFHVIRDSIALAAEKIRPGMEGREIDSLVRDYITGHGYDEFPHALGHQVGQKTHDGAGLLCPEWERYGKLPYLKVEESQVYTLEPRINIPDYGVATIEEIIVVTEKGGKFLSEPQRELILI